MALNFTPLSAYRFEVDKGIQQRAMNQARMGQGLGAVLGTALGMSQAAKTRDFFAQFDDSEEIVEKRCDDTVSCVAVPCAVVARDGAERAASPR